MRIKLLLEWTKRKYVGILASEMRRGKLRNKASPHHDRPEKLLGQMLNMDGPFLIFRAKSNKLQMISEYK